MFFPLLSLENAPSILILFFFLTCEGAPHSIYLLYYIFFEGTERRLYYVFMFHKDIQIHLWFLVIIHFDSFYLFHKIQTLINLVPGGCNIGLPLLCIMAGMTLYYSWRLVWRRLTEHQTTRSSD